MAGRTPSFVVVGLFIVMFLLGFFYMSCSSKTTELRQTLEEFEERMRLLTLKNSDGERKMESINARKREVEQEKSDIQRQMEKKDSELNDLNTKLNEKIAEVQSLKSDHRVLEEQLKEFKSTSDTLVLRNAAIEKLQQEYNEQSIRFQQEIENYKNQLQSLTNKQEKPFRMPNQRFPPLGASDQATKNSSSLFQEPLAKLSNITNEIKENVFNRLGIANNSRIYRNALPQEEQQLGQDEPARVPPKLVVSDDKDDEEPNIPAVPQRFQRSLNNSILDNKPLKHSKDTENDNKQSFDINKAQKTVNLSSIVHLNEINIVNNNQSNVAPSQLLEDEKNYRIADRDQVQQNKNNDQQERQQPLNNNGQEVIDDNNPQQQIPKGNLM